METTVNKFSTTGKDVAIVATNVLTSTLVTTFTALAELSSIGGARLVHAIDKNISIAEARAHYDSITNARLTKAGIRKRI